MKLALLVYLASISEKLSFIFGFISVILILLLAGYAMYLFIDDSPIKEKRKRYSFDDIDEINKHNSRVPVNIKKAKKISLLLSLIALLFGLISAAIPSEKTIYIMAGAYATEQIATNDRVQKIGSDVLEVIESKLSKMKEDK